MKELRPARKINKDEKGKPIYFLFRVVNRKLSSNSYKIIYNVIMNCILREHDFTDDCSRREKHNSS